MTTSTTNSKYLLVGLYEQLKKKDFCLTMTKIKKWHFLKVIREKCFFLDSHSICYVGLLFSSNWGLLSFVNSQTWRGKKLHELHRYLISCLLFSAKLVYLYAIFMSLNMPITNFTNIILIACKWFQICKTYLNSMVILCSTCKKEEKSCI